MTRNSRLLRAAPSIVVWVLLLIYFSIIQSLTDRLAGNDSYYHIKYAYLIWSKGALFEFPWLQGTFFKTVWVDKELLYHLMLIPFTVLGDLHLGAKAAGAFFGATAVTASYLYIRSFSDAPSWRRWSWVWALLGVCASSAALYRLSCARVPAASATFMMGALFLIERERPKALGILAFLYAWMYHVSVLLVPLAGLYLLSGWLCGRRPSVRPLIAVCLGLGLGFVINPYFPHSVPVLLKHVVQVGLGGTGLPKGNEWNPFDTWGVLQVAPMAWLFLCAAVLGVALLPARIGHRALFLMLAQAMFLAALFKARRFIEYWPLYSVVLLAAVLRAWVEHQRFTRRAPVWMAGAAVAALLFVAGLNAKQAARDMSHNAAPTRLRGATDWLRTHSPEGSIVYNAQWDIFPELLFHDHHNYWVMGLDPNFTYFLEPRLYEISVQLDSGQPLDMARHVSEDFGARYALALRGSSFYSSALLPTNGMEKVFEDRTAAVFAVRPPQDRMKYEAELSRRQDQARCARLNSASTGTQRASAGAFLRCQADGASGRLVFPFSVPAGRWTLFVRLARTPGASAQLKLDQSVVSGRLPLSGPGHLAPEVRLGTFPLSEGDHRLQLEYEIEQGKAFGLDYFRLEVAR